MVLRVDVVPIKLVVPIAPPCLSSRRRMCEIHTMIDSVRGGFGPTPQLITRSQSIRGSAFHSKVLRGGKIALAIVSVAIQLEMQGHIGHADPRGIKYGWRGRDVPSGNFAASSRCSISASKGRRLMLERDQSRVQFCRTAGGARGKMLDPLFADFLESGHVSVG